jgi:hypothetical protein
MPTPAEIIAERATTHGSYDENARVAQKIKDAVRSGRCWAALDPEMKETLDLAATKVGRILAGDANHLDHWVDLVGYYELIVRLLKARAQDAPGQSPVVTIREF